MYVPKCSVTLVAHIVTKRVQLISRCGDFLNVTKKNAPVSLRMLFIRVNVVLVLVLSFLNSAPDGLVFRVMLRPINPLPAPLSTVIIHSKAGWTPEGVLTHFCLYFIGYYEHTEYKRTNTHNFHPYCYFV
jgi:hypothetical protein